MKKVFKILSLILGFWLATLIVFERNCTTENTNINFNDVQLYLRRLENLRQPNRSVNSDFNAWQLLPPVEYGLTSEEKSSIVEGCDIPPGDLGNPVKLKPNLRYYIRQQIREGWQNQFYNQFVSDLIPVNRSLRDVRDDWCKVQKYSDLPKFSVIICFHNEAWSTLIRTVTSVLTRTPSNLLEEIILVDDYSSMSHLRSRLEKYVQSTQKIILLRTKKREGLIRARIIGTKLAKSPVVAFLDSHCECSVGWIEPLLERIKSDPTTVVSPVIDHIHETTFEYIPIAINDLQVGGFTWELRFIWIAIPEQVKIQRKNPAAPIKTPSIPGGLFAINKQFFERLGYYDEGLEIWGAENLEISIKTWTCGGTLEIVPCSRVGHVFKRALPNRDNQWDHKFFKRNHVRLAEVWLDDYAKYFYERIGNDKGDYGNVLEQKNLRNQLNCKSFKWYLDNVYPQLELPDNNVASGQIYALDKYNLCFDEPPIVHFREFISLLPCHFQGGNQFWTYTSRGEICRETLCLDYIHKTLTLNICQRSSTQVWFYNEENRYIRHVNTQQCLSIEEFPKGYKLALSNCTQRWMMENFKEGSLNHSLIYSQSNSTE